MKEINNINTDVYDAVMAEKKLIEEQKIVENNKREELYQKFKRRKRFRNFVGTVLLTATVGAGILAIDRYNTVDKDNLRYSQIVFDIDVHSGNAQIEGKSIGIKDKHSCIVEEDESKDYSERLEAAMQGQYSDKVIEDTLAQYEALKYGSYEDGLEARENLSEIQNSLYKNDDGLWDSNIHINKVMK